MVTVEERWCEILPLFNQRNQRKQRQEECGGTEAQTCSLSPEKLMYLTNMSQSDVEWQQQRERTPQVKGQS